MKKTGLVLAAALLVASCAKEAVDSDKQGFVGLWDPKVKDPDQQSEIEITADGRGHYLMVKPGSTVEFKGNVYFQGTTQFTIGGKVIKKKIKVNTYPYKIVESIKPYKYHYEAKFNGIEYIKKDQ